jgi:hypothetical protein
MSCKMKAYFPLFQYLEKSIYKANNQQLSYFKNQTSQVKLD